MPSTGEPCEHEHVRHRITAAAAVGGGSEDNEETEEELDENDFDTLSHIEGALDRLRVFALSVSGQLEVPCRAGAHCSGEGRCVQVSGTKTLNMCNHSHLPRIQAFHSISMNPSFSVGY